jgi:hypothetical protein
VKKKKWGKWAGDKEELNGKMVSGYPGQRQQRDWTGKSLETGERETRT